MKQTTIILLLAFIFPTAQGSPATSSPAASANDTVFICRTVTDAYYHAIYIEKNRRSKTYKRAVDFSFEKRDRRNYRAHKSNAEQEAPGIFTGPRHETYDLPQNWLPLYKYNDKYYLYDPSDGRCYRTIINKKEYISWGMEGPSPLPLKSVKKISDTRYILELANPFGRIPSSATQITIHIIDPATKMAVFESASKDGSYHRYRLCIPAANASNFDLIVNYCDNQRQMELRFEKIDYTRLLGNRDTR